MTRRMQLLVLATVVVLAFSPAIFAGFSKIDDVHLFEYYSSDSNWSLRSVFFPPPTGGYYRPLLSLSFHLDTELLGLRPAWMHAENILIHVLNGLLVYYLAYLMLPSSTRLTSPLPLLIALLFSLHPINSEPVNFLSGRSDLLAGCFIFLSAVAILLFREKGAKRYLAFAFSAFCCAVLSKETSLAFLPGVYFLITADRPQQHLKDDKSFVRYERILLLFVGLCLILFFVLIRPLSLTYYNTRPGLTLIAISTDWLHSMFVVLRAFGFYIKKLLIPYPLNFAIMQVDSLYEVFGVAAAALCMYIALRKKLLAAMFTTGIILIFPAFVIAFGQIAWTPYAERYLYMPSAFILISLVLYLSQKTVRVPQYALIAVVASVLIVASYSTVARSIVWQDDLSLCRDTVKKSPSAGSIRAVYAGLLAKKGEYNEALRQAELGNSLPALEYDERFDLVASDVYELQGNIDKAVSIDEEIVRKSRGKSERALENLVRLAETRKKAARTDAEKKKLDRTLFDLKLRLFILDHDPGWLYELAVMKKSSGDYQAAFRYLKQADRLMTEDNRYRKNVTKELALLAQKQNRP